MNSVTILYAARLASSLALGNKGVQHYGPSCHRERISPIHVSYNCVSESSMLVPKGPQGTGAGG